MKEQSDTPRMSIKFSGELGMSLLNRIAQLERERDEARAEVEILLATVERAKTVCGATADAYRHDYDSIKQHVAEAVKAEREAIASIGDERAKALLSVIGLAVVPSVVIQRDRAEQWRLYAAAIRARADNEVTK